MWVEHRWTFIRRFFGVDFTQKLFIMVWNWIYAQHDIRGRKYYNLQDAFVHYMFGTEPILWFQTFKKETWVQYWDNSHRGLMNYDAMMALSKVVGIFGPTAAIFGREFEESLIREPDAVLMPAERIEQSIRTSAGALTKEMIIPVDEQGGNEQQESHEHDRGQSSTRWIARTT